MISLVGRIRFGSLIVMSTLILLAFIVGCQKNDTVPTEPQAVYTNDDVANMIGCALAGSSATYGLTAQVLNACAIAADSGRFHSIAQPRSPQAVLFDTTFVKRLTSTGYSYSLQTRYSYTFGPRSDSLTFHFLISGTYSTPQLSGSDTSSATILVSHITLPDSQFLAQIISYSRYGNQVSKLGGKAQFYSDATLSGISLNVSKVTKQIQAGTGAIELTETDFAGNSTDYTGDMTFGATQSVIITLNDKPYLVNLATGAAVPIH